MIKLIVVDMDGTLLDDNKIMPKDMSTLIHKLHKNGVKFAIASGRQYFNLVKEFEELKDELIFIAENGMYIVEDGQEIAVHTMKKQDLMNFVEICRTIPHANPVVCGKQSAYIENNDPLFVEAVNKYYTKCTVVANVEDIQDDFLKLAIHNDNGTKENVYPHFKEFSQDFGVSVSAREWLDIMIKDIHKGKAVKEIQEKLHISYEETMVFGDFMNDFEMMQEGYYSYAMKNAVPKVIEVSNFITEFTNNEQGVKKEIEKYFPELVD